MCFAQKCVAWKDEMGLFAILNGRKTIMLKQNDIISFGILGIQALPEFPLVEDPWLAMG